MTSLEEHFGLSHAPFPQTASEAALLRYAALDAILERLRFALHRDTIASLIAESGCGKSTALFAKSLDAASYHVLAMSLTTVGPFGLISHVAALCGLRPTRFKGTTAAALIAHLRGLPKRTVLLIDESHLLPDDSLEDLRQLDPVEQEQEVAGVELDVRRRRLRDVKHAPFEPSTISMSAGSSGGSPVAVGWVGAAGPPAPAGNSAALTRPARAVDSRFLTTA
jgi:hypothetical protein